MKNTITLTVLAGTVFFCSACGGSENSGKESVTSTSVSGSSVTESITADSISGSSDTESVISASSSDKDELTEITENIVSDPLSGTDDSHPDEDALNAVDADKANKTDSDTEKTSDTVSKGTASAGTASSSNNSAGSSAVHTHAWTAVYTTETVHHDAVYQTVHHDAIMHEEPQYTAYVVCNTCGAQFLTDSELNTHQTSTKEYNASGGVISMHGGSKVVRIKTGTITVTDQEAYDEEVLVSAAYDEEIQTLSGYQCSGCGAFR